MRTGGEENGSDAGRRELAAAGGAAAARTASDPAVEGKTAAEDWCDVLQRLVQGDPIAHVRVTNVIMGLLARSRVFDLEPLWEDICQEVLTAVVRSVQRGVIRDPRAFVGYCATITRNELARRLEQVRRSRTRDDGTETDEMPQPERRDRDMDLLIDMSRALETLPEKIRNALRAIYLEGRSYEEASSHLGMPLGTLKRMQTQGLRMLRESMGAGE